MPPALRQVMPDRIAADQQGQLDLGEIRAQSWMPERRAFRPRRQIPAARIAAGIAETHTHNRDAGLVVEGVAVEHEPLAQPVAAPVVEGKPGFVHPRAGRLADDQKPRFGPAAHQGLGPSGSPAQCLHARISAISRSNSPGETVGRGCMTPQYLTAAFGAAELTCLGPLTRFVAAYAVHPLIGGGVAEWLKAAVC